MSEEGGESGVWVIDTSSILQIRRMYDPSAPESHHRRIVSAEYTQRLFEHLGDLIVSGRLTYPTQVHQELYASSSPDSAGRWSQRYVRQRVYQDPEYETLISIQRTISIAFGPGKDLVDYAKEEDADPWIVAQAKELRDAGLLSAVVTEEVRNRAHTVSIKAACEHLGLGCINVLEFLNHCDAPPEPGG